MRLHRPFVLIDDSLAGESLLFSKPRRILRADAPDEVAGVFEEMEAARRAGFHLAGYASYELGYLLEPKLARLLPDLRRAPLLLFGVFDIRRRHEAEFPQMAGLAPLRPAWTLERYRQGFDRALDYIAAGDVYQINLTFTLEGRFTGDPIALYGGLRRRQPVAHGAIVALGRETVLSLSPELFFETAGNVITAKPMKGTAPRGATPNQDADAVLRLKSDDKQRAENLMIVDLLRNDLSRIARIGSVHVPKLFEVETYPTLHQMTSTIRAELRPDTTIARLFASLFPCGSVTGAPKIRAMEVIRELEDRPREIYCGAIGFIAPDGQMHFNVAIRTLTIYPDGEVGFDVGSGVVADSRAEAEYEECLVKSRFLTSA